MSKNGFLNTRMDQNLLNDVHAIFSDLGISKTDAITMFYAQVRLNNGLPFDVKIPNKETKQTFRKTDRGEELHTAKDVDDMFSQLEM